MFKSCSSSISRLKKPLLLTGLTPYITTTGQALYITTTGQAPYEIDTLLNSSASRGQDTFHRASPVHYHYRASKIDMIK